MLNEVQQDSSDRIESEGCSSMEIPEPKSESAPVEEPEAIEETTESSDDKKWWNSFWYFI